MGGSLRENVPVHVLTLSGAKSSENNKEQPNKPGPRCILISKVLGQTQLKT